MTSKKTAKGIAVLAATLLLVTMFPAALAHSSKTSGPVPVELTWANDEIWEFLVVGKFSIPAAESSHRPLYALAPIPGASHSPNAPEGTDPGVGDHDHVIDPPNITQGAFTAVWHVYAVLPGPMAQPGTNARIGFVPLDLDEDGTIDPGEGFPSVYAADLNGDGTISCDAGAGQLSECLTSVAKIHAALASGLAMALDPGIVFVCPVRPHSTR